MNYTTDDGNTVGIAGAFRMALGRAMLAKWPIDSHPEEASYAEVRQFLDETEQLYNYSKNHGGQRIHCHVVIECANCNRPDHEHVGEKCLFGATRLKCDFYINNNEFRLRGEVVVTTITDI